ncbi:MAG: diguanylate cyclase [Deltaproteobacteria bacterium]|nr:diguanylate cyclase [Deltaproteobacteria bacterium]
MPDKRILLVDDDPDIVSVLSRFLNRQGYTVVSAASGREALERFHSQTFPIVILDLKLPDIPGLELLPRLKEQAPDTEVILFTGLGGLESAVQALRLGAYDYIVKSELRLPDLQAVVNRALERRRLSRANRELVEHLRQAREELAARRKAELAQIRRIGEALAQPLAPEQLTAGLLNLIWESLPLAILGLTLQNRETSESWGGERRQPDLAPEVYGAFQRWFRDTLAQVGREENPDGVSGAVPESPVWPLPAMLWKAIRVEGMSGLAAAGRQEPFTPEEAELFRIFLLQGEAALKNLLLFEEVKSLAVRDGLTGLYNYRYFWEMLNQQVEQSRRYGWPLSLLFLDIDDFKKVNDTLGHPQGDLVLQALARYLGTQVRQADLLCRYGGEEFVILLPQSRVEQALILAERLRDGIATTPFPLADREVHITVSIGVAGLAPGMDGTALVKAADTALYHAKRSGRNQVSGVVELFGQEAPRDRVTLLPESRKRGRRGRLGGQDS